MCSSPRASSAARTLSPGADGDGALHDHDGALLDLSQLVQHRPHGGEVRVPGVGRRRADADEHEACAVDRLARVEREGQPITGARQHLLEPRLVEGHPAGAQRLDLLGDDVANDDVVPEIGEARPRDETRVARAEDRDPFAHASQARRLPRLHRLEAGGDPQHRLVRRSSLSVFTTQYDLSPSRSTTMCRCEPEKYRSYGRCLIFRVVLAAANTGAPVQSVSSMPQY